MKKLFINIALFLCVVLPPLYLLQYFVDAGLRKTYFTQGCMNDVYSGKASTDVLIMGASNAKFQYSPKILDSMLGINCYNMGISGWPFHMQYALFKMYLQHNKKPKYIIQNLNGTLLSYQDQFYEYDQFIPYAHDTIIKRFTSNLKGGFTFSELYFPMFIYNNHFYYVKQGLKTYFHIGAPVPAPTYKGYVPHMEQWDGAFDEFKKNHPDGVKFVYSDTVKQEFVSFLEDCKNMGIQVIFAYAPIYIEETKMVRNHGEMLQLFGNLAKQYNIPVLDYNNDSISYEKRYFFNSQHLNIEGSELFSKKLAGDLKGLLKL